MSSAVIVCGFAMGISTFRKLCSLNASLVDYYGETEKKKPPKPDFVC